MKYYITTPELAQGISALKAQQMGCTGVTAFWWPVQMHPDSTQAALCISDQETALAPAVDEYTDLAGNIIPAVPAETVKTLYLNGSVTITTADLVDALPAGWVLDPVTP